MVEPILEKQLKVPVVATPLLQKLRRMIRLDGPISLANYMHLCLADPDQGYYRSKEAIGAKGDFITAPEISQMFGELIGAWCIDTWQKLGEPEAISLVEFGPGNGTLMKDLLRTAQAVPGFAGALEVTLIETSERLIARQREILANVPHPVTRINWATNLDSLKKQPVIILANEFFDALPFRQYVKKANSWHEIGIGLDEANELRIIALPTTLENEYLPLQHDQQAEGAVFEIAPAREALALGMAEKIASQTGAALIIDYGHLQTGFGDTFQAIKNHAFANPLESPGEADLTSHVDFQALAKSIQNAHNKLQIQQTNQGNFLVSQGLLERAGMLGNGKSNATKTALIEQVERLAGPDQMGDLFKVMVISSMRQNIGSL